MPLFDYHCDDCGYDFETIVKEPEQTVYCKKCHSSNVQQQFPTKTGLNFKGDWYATTKKY